MRDELLQIGLGKNEVAVYLALLDVGKAKAGELIKKTGLHRNLVYTSLEALEKRNLLTKISGKTAVFQVTDPTEILNLIKKQESIAQRIVDELKMKKRVMGQKITLYEGDDGFRAAFWDILGTLKRGEEYQVMGVFEYDPKFHKMIADFHRERSKAGIKVRILLNSTAEGLSETLGAMPLTEVRYMQQDLETPTIFIIYGNKTLISIPNQRTFILIENPEVAPAFRSYFDTLWNQKTITFRGKGGFQTAFWDMIETLGPGEELQVMGVFDIDEEFQGMIKTFHEERAEKGIPARILLNAHAKHVGTMLDQIDKTDVKYMPPGMTTPSVFFIYGDKTMISLPNRRTFFRIEDKEVTAAFRTYFNTLWDQTTITYKGEDGVKAFTEKVLEVGEPVSLLGAHFRFRDIYPEHYREWHAKRTKQGLAIQATIPEEAAAKKPFENIDLVETRSVAASLFPNVVWVFGDYVANAIWVDKENTIIFLIHHPAVAAQYREHFNHFWESGKKGA